MKHNILNVWLWSIIQEQALSVLVSHDSYCYLSIKKLFWFNFLIDFTDMKLVLTRKNSKPSFHMLMIQSFTFLQVPRICSAEQIRGISGNFHIVKFTFYFEISKALFIYFKYLIWNVSGAVKQEIAHLYQLLQFLI